jgi:transposase-like protein
VLAGLEAGVEVSDLCRREALSPALYYQWKRKPLAATKSRPKRVEYERAGTANI